MALTSAPEFSFRTRRHFWLHLKNHKDVTYNVIIIGGGIVGAGLLREMGLQGVPLTFLFEKNDFASGTSGNSSKLIHAGIRYLELAWNGLKKMNFKEAWNQFLFVWGASRERKILTGIAPHLIKPKPIFFVIGEQDGRWPVSVWMGIWFYWFIQVLQGQFFPPPSFAFRKSTIKKMAPDIEESQVKAVFCFWDSETDDARLVMENLQSAHSNGCYAMNYVEVLSYEQKGDLTEVRVKNRENNEEISIKSKILINASGPFIDEVIKKEKGRTTPPQKHIDRVAGSHIDVYPKITTHSYYITAGDGRLVFVLKRHEDGLEFTRLGTTERSLQDTEPSDNPKATEVEINYLKDLVRVFFPNVQINSENICRIDCGIRPLKYQDKKNAYSKSRDHEIIQEKNVFHIIGVKLTDYRSVSSEMMGVLPWKKIHLNMTDLKRSKTIPLRENSSPRLYAEDNIIEMARRTMIVHWNDYVERRRGLGPRVLKKVDLDAYEKEFEELAKMMEWDKITQDEEKSRVSS